MSHILNPLTVTSQLHSRTDTSSTPRDGRGTTSGLPDILTYSYGSRMVYVSPGEDYDVCSFLPSQPDPLLPLLIDTPTQRAIDIAIESFPELSDVQRNWIRLEVRVVLSPQSQQSTAVQIGRTAWPSLVATLARFKIVEVRVTPPQLRSVRASSGLVLGSTPYGSETGLPEYSENAQTDFVAYGAHMPSLLLQPHSHATRVAVDVVPPWLSQGRHSPQLR
jgi:hypothetical protein